MMRVLRLLLMSVIFLVAAQALGSGVGLEATPEDAPEIDLTRLPLGDHRLSNMPEIGWLWPCHTDPNAGGAFINGPWIDTANGTYDFTAKAVVNGAVEWPQHEWTMTVEGNKRIITTNDLPDHITGIFPVARIDPASRYDPNPNRITPQNFRISLPVNPTLAAQPSCAPGALGIMVSGVVLFNALDGPGRDAPAHEVQDACQAHPNEKGVYHYHSMSTCISDAPSEDGLPALVGYSLDGFGIYGQYEDGKRLTSADLDECHGHTSPVMWDNQVVTMYHYTVTEDFPYTIGCMRGLYSMADMMTISGGSR